MWRSLRHLGRWPQLEFYAVISNRTLRSNNTEYSPPLVTRTAAADARRAFTENKSNKNWLMEEWREQKYGFFLAGLPWLSLKMFAWNRRTRRMIMMSTHAAQSVVFIAAATDSVKFNVGGTIKLRNIFKMNDRREVFLPPNRSLPTRSADQNMTRKLRLGQCLSKGHRLASFHSTNMKRNNFIICLRATLWLAIEM